MHLLLYMHKRKGNTALVNNRDVCIKTHDAVSFLTDKPNSEKYKKNVFFYKGALAWNSLSVQIRKPQMYIVLKDLLNQQLIAAIVPKH